MTFFWLNAITAARLLVCVPVWWWCWLKRPRAMVLWMTLAGAAFLVTDLMDGYWARTHGLESTLGFWLDHSADVLFYGSLFVTMWLGTREAGARRRHKRTVALPPAPTKSPPPA